MTTYRDFRKFGNRDYAFDKSTFFTDFHTFNAADWTITTTEAGAGSATEAIAARAGGWLLVTNDAADNDADFFQSAEFFKHRAGKKWRLAGRFEINDVVDSDFIFGLAITDTSPLDASDGIWFVSEDGAATLAAKAVKNSSATTKTGLATLVNATAFDLELYYDGDETIAMYIDGARVGSFKTTDNIPDDEELAITFGLMNGAAAAKTLSVDFLLLEQER